MIGEGRKGPDGPGLKPKEKKTMKILTKEDLARRSDTELAVLHAQLTAIMALAEHGNPQWHAARASIANIASVRATRRFDSKPPSPL